jgi:hypothetical protein
VCAEEVNVLERSTSRIVTTRVGSLPRPADWIPLLIAKDSGQAYDLVPLRELERNGWLTAHVRSSKIVKPEIPGSRAATSLTGLTDDAILSAVSAPLVA